MDDLKMNITVSQFVEREVKRLEEKYQLLHEKNAQDLLKTECEIERRLEGINKFKEQIDSERRTFVTREEYLLSEKLINQKIDTISKIAYIAIGIAIVLELVFKFLIK